MILDIKTTNLCFDDILLVPKYSNVESRSNVSLASRFGNPKNPEAWIDLRIPLMTAPMEFINSNAMIETILKHGGMAFIHRFQSEESRFLQFTSLPKDIQHLKTLGFGISIIEAQDPVFIKKLLSYGIKTVVVDTALGHTNYSINAVKKLRGLVPNYFHIMTGNVSSYEAYKDLMDAGADSVRVGIGGGAACTTRVVTGFGVPVLGSIIDIYNNINNDTINGLIADGGIKQTGDIVKAIAAGASAVMMGNMFAGHEECDGKIDGKFLFRGVSSEGIKIDSPDHTQEEIHHIEGVSGYLLNKGSIHNTLIQMSDNIKSGLSYCGSINLIDFKKECRFIQVSSESIKESGSRI